MSPLYRHSLLVFISLGALSACQNNNADTTTTTPQTVAITSTTDQKFTDISQQALDSWMLLSPISATQIGEHRYDAEIDDLSAAGRQARLQSNQQLLADLEGITIAELSRENQVDAALLRNQLQSNIWREQTLQGWAWDPQVYNSLAGGAIYSLMARDFAPLPERLAAATARIEKIPTLLAQARENLDAARVPATHAEIVVKQNKGILSIVSSFITPHIDTLPTEEAKRLHDAITQLEVAVAEHQDWLENTLLPNAKGDFRIGAQMYDQKLQFALLSSLSRTEIKQRAEAELKDTREQMYTIARDVLKDDANAPALPDTPDDTQQQAAIEAALELAYVNHPARDQVVPEAKASLKATTEFARSHDLVTVPDTPVDIILMPEFQRGVAVAYCDSPGPLDKGQKTFYAISPIPDNWDDAKSESFLREYNDEMIHLLSIHEGVPGHYLEGQHSAEHPSILRGVLRSGMFAEGWAVYTEKMMADTGYRNDDPLFKLVQLKFYLRSIANALLDQGVHVDNWTREQAMHLMTHDAFQQESEAAGKWIRAQLGSAQLPTYFVGAQEHWDTRKAVEAQQGEQFNLKAYHDQLLSYGAPPVRFARQLMLDQPIE